MFLSALPFCCHSHQRYVNLLCHKHLLRCILFCFLQQVAKPNLKSQKDAFAQKENSGKRAEVTEVPVPLHFLDVCNRIVCLFLRNDLRKQPVGDRFLGRALRSSRHRVGPVLRHTWRHRRRRQLGSLTFGTFLEPFDRWPHCHVIELSPCHNNSIIGPPHIESRRDWRSLLRWRMLSGSVAIRWFR